LNFKKINLPKKTHFFWLILKHISTSGLLALKFFLAAKILGPEKMGIAGIVILVTSVVESLSETGMLEAVIQSHIKLNPLRSGSVLIIQLLRGGFVTVTLLLFALPISNILNSPESYSLILLAAPISLIRNAVNPGVFLLRRHKDFKKIFFYEAVGSIFDISITFTLIYQGFGPEAIVFGMILGDFLRLFMSWTFFRIPTVPNINFRVIQDLITFGKWIWGAGVLTVLLNQIDKILVIKFLGVTEFSFYQMSSRIAQLVITDGPILLGQYLYPNFCERNRISRLNLNKYFKRIFIFMIFVIFLPLIFLEISAPIIVQSFFGEEWNPMVKLIRLMAIPMYLGAIIAILLPYVRSIGRPSIITNTTILQFISLCVLSVPLIYFYQLTGMIMAISLAGFTAILYLLFNVYPLTKIILSPSKKKL